MITENVSSPLALVPLERAFASETCGRKAATLARLIDAGHRVPDGFVVPVGGALDGLGAALERLGEGPFAVRSSGAAEDGEAASHAGEYDTVLGPTTLEEVRAAVERVRASAGGTTPMAVLVQRLVQPDVAGVMFTANPISGDDEVILEAVEGLGDALMDGAAEGERWTVTASRAAVAGDPAVLDEARARTLAALGRRIAREQGAPQDIEWAEVAGAIHVLQARPITRLPIKPAIAFPPGRWVKDQSHFTGPVTPVAATILLPAYEVGIAHMARTFGLPLETVRQRAFGGEVYTQDVDVSGSHDPAAPPPWWVLALVFRLVPALRACDRVAKRALTELDAYPRRWANEWRDACDARIAAAREVELPPLDDAALSAELERLIDEVLVPHLEIHFDLTFPHALGLYDLHACCAELLGWEESQTMELLAGLSSATTQATTDLAAIAPNLDEAALDGTLDDVLASDAGPAMAAWLRHWGLRTIDVDPGVPTTAEREDLVMIMLREAKHSKRDPAKLEAERQKKVAAARARLTGGERSRFDAALAYAELVYPMRDDNVPYTEGLPCGLIRRVLLEMGRRLVERGALHAAEDVAFLERDELAAALSGALRGETAADRVRRRRAENAWVSAHPGPPVVGPALVPDPDVRGLPKASRRVMEVMFWAIAGELAPPTGGAEADGTLTGIPVSPGRYTGLVRIVRCEAELSQLRPGEVLVCPTTHSSWTVAFGHAGALVADGGGLLAHPAIIAREHAIPAVLGTVCATETLHDGQVVTVDGAAGRVQVH